MRASFIPAYLGVPRSFLGEKALNSPRPEQMLCASQGVLSLCLSLSFSVYVRTWACMCVGVHTHNIS